MPNAAAAAPTALSPAGGRLLRAHSLDLPLVATRREASTAGGSARTRGLRGVEFRPLPPELDERPRRAEAARPQPTAPRRRCCGDDDRRRRCNRVGLPRRRHRSSRRGHGRGRHGPLAAAAPPARPLNERPCDSRRPELRPGAPKLPERGKDRHGGVRASLSDAGRARGTRRSGSHRSSAQTRSASSISRPTSSGCSCSWRRSSAPRSHARPKRRPPSRARATRAPARLR